MATLTGNPIRTEIFSSTRAERERRAAELNRCDHSVNVVMQRCPLCDREGKFQAPRLGGGEPAKG